MHVQKASLERQAVAAVAAAVNVLDVHVHVVAAVEGTGADVAHEDARHSGVHRPPVARQVGVLRELGRALVAAKVAARGAAGAGRIPPKQCPHEGVPCKEDRPPTAPSALEGLRHEENAGSAIHLLMRNCEVTKASSDFVFVRGMGGTSRDTAPRDVMRH